MKRKSAFTCPVLIMAVAMLFVVIVSGTCNAASESPTVNVGSELEFAPYAFVDENGQPAGFSVDLIRAVADSMGLSINISPGTWSSVWNDLVKGRLDALPIVAKLPERTLLVDFSLPHTETYDSFFVRAGDPVIKTIESAIGKEIVVMRADAAHHALLERNFQGSIILVDTIPEGLSLISSGKHDAFLCSKLIGALAVRNHKLKGLTSGPTIPDYKRVFSFAVKKGDTELLEKLNQGLLIIKASGEYQQIYDKWLRVDDPWLKFEIYFMPIILVVMTIVLIGSIWLFMLKRMVNERTRELADKNKLLRQATEGLEVTVKDLQDSEEKYRAFFEQAPDSVCLIDAATGDILAFNDKTHEKLGYSREEFIKLRLSDYEVVESEEDIKNHIEIVLKQGHDIFETKHRTKNGQILNVLVSTKSVSVRDKKFIQSIWTDITVLKQAEKQMKLMALFAELNPSPVFRFDEEGNVLMANPAAVEILHRGSLIGLPLTSLIPDIEELDFAVCIRDGTILSHSVKIDDRFFHFIFRGLPELKTGQIYGSDITEQKKVENSAILTSNLTSIGELAAGVAHEINNPINGVINYAQMIVDRTREESREHEISRMIIKEGDRIASIVRSLLYFAHENQDERHFVNINETATYSLDLVRAQIIKEGIILKVNIPSGLPSINIQPQHIEQVFLNMISNARYALNRKYPGVHENKILEILGEEVLIDNNPFIQITFYDRGYGIPDGIKDKIMKPFFTTKPSGIGTGLGLSISQGIINDHGGRIIVDSVEEEFTKIIIGLPQTAKSTGQNN